MTKVAASTWKESINYLPTCTASRCYLCFVKSEDFFLWVNKDRFSSDMTHSILFNVSGPVFGSKDYFVGLAIIADTYSNHNGPHNVSFIIQMSITCLYMQGTKIFQYCTCPAG